MSKVKHIAKPSTGIKEISLVTLVAQGEPLFMQYAAFGFEGMDHQALFAFGCSAFILMSRLFSKYRNA